MRYMDVFCIDLHERCLIVDVYAWYRRNSKILKKLNKKTTHMLVEKAKIILDKNPCDQLQSIVRGYDKKFIAHLIYLHQNMYKTKKKKSVQMGLWGVYKVE